MFSIHVRLLFSCTIGKVFPTSQGNICFILGLSSTLSKRFQSTSLYSSFLYWGSAGLAEYLLTICLNSPYFSTAGTQVEHLLNNSPFKYLALKECGTAAWVDDYSVKYSLFFHWANEVVVVGYSLRKSTFLNCRTASGNTSWTFA